MNKYIFPLIFIVLLLCMTGCSPDKKNDVKIYENTEEIVVEHEETTCTMVVTDINLDSNIMSFVECSTGISRELIYHGGVSITNTYGDTIGVHELYCGSVVDVEYYSDTNKIVSIALNASTTVLKGINKFSVDVEGQKATYKGTSCDLSEFVRAYDGDTPIDIREINSEDEVTLNIYGGKLVSAIINVGHGYVRLVNQDTYIGGMVEIGYDVIVPVTSDMLVAVREGMYTLRINKGSYNATKQVQVNRGRETVVDISSIAVPTGTVTFKITPEDADIYINGDIVYGNIYTNSYGTYGLKIEADGYKTFNGSFQIKAASRTFTINLTEMNSSNDSDDDDSKTTESTTNTTNTTETSSTDTTKTTEEKTTASGTYETVATTTENSESTGDKDSQTSSETTAATTESGQTTNNKITIKLPLGASVYVDGEYVGIVPVSFPKVVGTHTITLYKPGYLIKSYTIQAKDDGKDDEHSFPDLIILPDP